MALQVWLPLTQDARNQGLCSGTVTTSGATFADGGKLGGKYFSGGTITIPATMSKKFFNKTGMSFAFWLYPVGTSGTGIIMGQNTMTAGDNRMYSVFQYPTINDLHISWQDETSDSTFLTGSWEGFFPADTWTHCCIVYDGNTVIIYRNGEQYVVVEGVSNRANFEYAYPITGSATKQLQDVRIYNHCLTPEEVKKIAQGLVLHYPLNHQGWEGENLVWDTHWDEFSTKWNAWGSPSIREIVSTYGKKYLHVKSSDRWQGYSQNQAKRNGIGEIVAGEKLTLSCWAYSNTTLTDYPCIGIHWTDGTSIIAQSWPLFTITTTPQKFTTILTVPDGVSAFNIMVGNGDGTVDGVYEIWVANVKLEKGEIATSWCPNSSDELAIRAGINEAIEYDISGFENNGIRIADGNNLFKGTTFSSFDRSNFVVNSSTDWTAYLRYYNGNAANHSFSDGIDTITLNAVSNLGVAFVRKATDINLDSNSYYTISCEAMSTQTAQPLCIGLSYYNTSNAWVWRGGTNGTNFTAANTWQKFSFTFTPDADTQYICYCFTVVGTLGGTDTFKIRNCKLEKGSVATDWTPGVIQKYTSDTPKYQVSTEFNDNTYIKYKGPENMTHATYSLWVNQSSFTQYGMIHGQLGSPEVGHSPWFAMNTEDSGLWAYIGNNIPQYTKAGTDNLAVNTWYHIVYVWNNGVARWYLNGEPYGNEVTYTTRNTITNSAESTIGDSYTGTSWAGTSFKGKISDFRLYATALSAEDIQALYQAKNIPD